jgi:hypothetical protein
VVHENTGHPGNEAELNAVSRHDVPIGTIGGDLGGVEIHRVRDQSSVHEGEIQGIADRHAR